MSAQFIKTAALLLLIALLAACGPSSGVPPESTPASPPPVSLPSPPPPVIPSPVPSEPKPASSTPAPTPWEEVIKYLGETRTVQGPVLDTRYAANSRGQPTFLNVGKAYPKPGRFTVVIWGSERTKFLKKFPTGPESALLNKIVQVTGIIKEYPKGSGNTEIELDDPEKIKVLE